MAHKKHSHRMQAWRRKYPMRAKLIPYNKDVSDDQRREDRIAFAKGHEHACVRCRNPYTCSNACERIGEGLQASICDPCFDREATRV